MSRAARNAASIFVLVTLSGVSLWTSAVVAQPRSDYDAFRLYFDGLLERRLFSLAETVCLRKLNDQTLSRTERGQYTIELCRSLTEHAAFVGSLDEQNDLFDRARNLVNETLAGRNDHPLQTTLAAQALLATAREVELLRLRFELDPLDPAPRDRGRLLSDMLVPQFEKLDEQLREEVRHAKPDILGERLSPYQLRGVLQTVELRYGLLLLDRARLLPDFTPDRAEALGKADQLLSRLASGSPGEMTTWQSQIALAETKRLGGEDEIVSRLLAAMRADNPPPTILDAIVSEEVELLLRKGDFTAAVDQLRQHRVLREGLDGRLSFLMSSALLELWKLAESKGQSELAAELLVEVGRFVEQARADGNVYWARRAERLLGSVKSVQSFGAAAGELVRQGQMLYSAGKLDDAADAYGKAFKAAVDDAPDDVPTESAAELGYTFGSLLLQLRKYEPAAATFGELVAGWPTWKKAPDAHVLQAFTLGMLYRQQPTAERREAYTNVLEAHLTLFPTAPTVGDSLWMLAQLDEQRLQTSKALQLYARIPIDHARGLDAQVAIARCGEVILDRLRKLGKSRAEWEAVLIPRLAEAMKSFVHDTSPLKPGQAELALRFARILLRREQPDFASADQLLQRVVSGTPNPALAPDDPAQPIINLTPEESDAIIETRRRAIGLRVVSLAGRGLMGEARTLLEESARAETSRLPQLLEGLISAADGLNAVQQRQLGELQLRAIELSEVDVEALPVPERATFLSTLGDANELAGRTDVAVTVFEQLLTVRPTDAGLRRRIAMLCREIGTSEFLAIAKPHWQKLESAEKAGTVAWLEARLELLRTMLGLKETAEVRKLLKVTRLLYPDLGNKKLKQSFVELESSLQ
jgi:tetratricopeptide (TPR) repeat protein